MPLPSSAARALLIRLLAGLAPLVAAASARAQAPQASTIAEALFKDAQAHLAAGQVHEACDLFGRSQAVEPATGTLLNLAACHEREGRTATAWTEFSLAADQATRAADRARAQYATTRMAALDRQLDRVVVEMLEPAPGMRATLDGAELPREAWGTAIPLDPGEHVIEVVAPGFARWVRKLNMGPASGTDRIEVRLVPDVAIAAPAPVVLVAPAPPPSPPPQDVAPGPPARQGAKRIAGWVVGGAGVAMVGVASVFGANVLSNVSERNKLCTPDVPCGSAQAFADDHAARVDQTWMFVTGAVGFALLGTGTYLLVSSLGEKTRTPSPSALRVSPLASRDTAGLELSGSFR